jgi:hypothetical protein
VVFLLVADANKTEKLANGSLGCEKIKNIKIYHQKILSPQGKCEK